MAVVRGRKVLHLYLYCSHNHPFNRSATVEGKAEIAFLCGTRISLGRCLYYNNKFTLHVLVQTRICSARNGAWLILSDKTRGGRCGDVWLQEIFQDRPYTPLRIWGAMEVILGIFSPSSQSFVCLEGGRD